VSRFVFVIFRAKRVNPLIAITVMLGVIALAAPFAPSAAAAVRCSTKGRPHRSAAKRCPKVTPHKCRSSAGKASLVPSQETTEAAPSEGPARARHDSVRTPRV
jgi:hypothetical protein